MSSYISKITAAKCTYKGAYKLGSKLLLEFYSPQGISMAVNLGELQRDLASLRSTTVSYTTSKLKGVDRQTLLEVMRESNGMTPVLVLEGRVAFLTTGASVPRLDGVQFVDGEEYELINGDARPSHLRFIPVVSSAEFEASSAECIKLCDRVYSRLSAQMMRSVLESGKRIDEAYSTLTSSALEYFRKREDALSLIVRDVRSGRDTDVKLVQRRERDFELLHSHVRDCLLACEAIESFNVSLVQHNADVDAMI